MKERNVYFCCPDDKRYCSDTDFVSHNNPSAKRWWMGADPEPGAIYIVRHEATNQSIFAVEFLLMKDARPEVSHKIDLKKFTISQDGWIRSKDVLHGIMAKMVKQAKAVEIMDALVEHQEPFVHNDKLPKAGTWGYAVKAATSFKPQQRRQILNLLLTRDDALRPEYHELLSSQTITDFVICASSATTYPGQMMASWRRVRAILHRFGYHQRIHMWDSLLLSRQLTLYPHVLAGIARFWVKELTTLE